MRILLADDHALFRDGVGSLLEAWGHQVVGQAADGAQAIDLAARLRPDLVLMDVRMPGVSGLVATERIKTADPRVSVVMLTVSEDEDDLFTAIQMGAQGYLLKNLESRELRAMIEAVGRGEPAISPQTAARILHEFARAQRPTESEPERLTDRELSVLRLVVDGLRNKEIAAELGISENTVKFHLKNTVEKLHVRGRAELAVRAVREGLLTER